MPALHKLRLNFKYDNIKSFGILLNIKRPENAFYLFIYKLHLIFKSSGYKTQKFPALILTYTHVHE